MKTKKFKQAAEPTYTALDQGKIIVTQYTVDELTASNGAGNATRILKEVIRECADFMNSGTEVTLSRQAGSHLYKLGCVSGTVMNGTERVLSGCKDDQTAPLNRAFSESLINAYVHSFGMDRAIRVIPVGPQQKKQAKSTLEPVT